MSYLVIPKDGDHEHPWAAPAADLVEFLASGAADRLSGRFFGVHDDCRAMAARSNEIEGTDLYTLRLRR